jgi:hypothetical protein
MMAAEKLPVEVAARTLAASTSGYYAWLTRGPSVREVRHALLTGVIREAHIPSRGWGHLPRSGGLRHPVGACRADPRPGPGGLPRVGGSC